MDLLEKSPGIKLIDKREDGGYITPDETAGENDVFIRPKGPCGSTFQPKL